MQRPWLIHSCTLVEGIALGLWSSVIKVVPISSILGSYVLFRPISSPTIPLGVGGGGIGRKRGEGEEE